MLRMVRDLLHGSRPLPASRARRRLKAATWPTVVYAIGDVHGCLDELKELEAAIVADAAGLAGEKWIVLLGDYVDRGPNSAGVVAHTMAEGPIGFRKLALAGNHEQMLIEFLETPSHGAAWLDLGGLDTARSYGISSHILERRSPRQIAAVLAAAIPPAHLEWLRDLPILLELPGTVFVHAGLAPGLAIEAQDDFDLLSLRDHKDVPHGPLVVHGHVAHRDAVVTPWRICVDTGAYATGMLTAVRLSRHEPPRLLSVGAP